MSKAAVAQIQSSTEKTENLRAALDLIKEARSGGAELIVFPEFLMAFSPASQSAEELSQIAETIEGRFRFSAARARKPRASPSWRLSTNSSGRKSGLRQRRLDRCTAETSPRSTVNSISTTPLVSKNRTNFIPAPIVAPLVPCWANGASA